MKYLFEKPLFAFSGKYYTYSNSLDPYDMVAGDEAYKGLYLYNLDAVKKIKIDSKILGKEKEFFSKDGSLYVSSLSFSYDGK